MASLYNELSNDVRFTEGLNACMNCGICNAICPAAEFYDYDPRGIVTTVQSGNQERIQELLEGENIWYCGQCMSCKTRCPRGNCPGMVISILRKFSQETGAFINSKHGRRQYLIRLSIGNNILERGYCVHPKSVVPDTHPEQGPVWEWVYNNADDVFDTLGGNLDKDGPGTLRRISDESLGDLKKIFEVTGGLDLYNSIDYFSKKKAVELGFVDAEGNPDMDRYVEYLMEE